MGCTCGGTRTRGRKVLIAAGCQAIMAASSHAPMPMAPAWVVLVRRGMHVHRVEG